MANIAVVKGICLFLFFKKEVEGWLAINHGSKSRCVGMTWCASIIQSACRASLAFFIDMLRCSSRGHLCGVALA